MDIYAQMVDRIIKRHEKILGIMASKVAEKVPGLTIDHQTRIIILQDNKKEILEKLLTEYEKMLGKVAIINSKEWVKDLIAQLPSDQLPQTLL
jgi:hypothetical protein